MMHFIVTRTLYEKRWFVVGWACAIGLTVWMVLLFYHAFSNTTGIEQLFANMPEQFKAFLGDPEANKNIAGYIGQQVYDIRVALFIMIMGLMFANSLALRDEEDGHLRTLSTIPHSRRHLLLSRWFVGVLVMGIAALASTVGTYLGLLSIGETAPHEQIWQLCALTWLFGTTAFTIPYAIGAATGHRGITMTFGLIVTIGSFILATFAKAVDWLKDWQWLSLMSYFNTVDVVKNGFVVHDIVVMGALVAVTLGVALLIFPRRDIS